MLPTVAGGRSRAGHPQDSSGAYYNGPRPHGDIWLSLEGMRRTWTMWKDTYDASRRAGVWNDIPRGYAHETCIPGWVPLTDSGGGGWGHWIDLDPGPKGTLGQILMVFSDSTAVVAPSICEWLWNYVGDFEAGKWVRSKNGGCGATIVRTNDPPLPSATAARQASKNSNATYVIHIVPYQSSRLRIVIDYQIIHKRSWQASVKVSIQKLLAGE